MNRKLLIVIAPVAMLAGFVTVLVREFGRAFRCAYLEARIELGAARRHWERLK